MVPHPISCSQLVYAALARALMLSFIKSPQRLVSNYNNALNIIRETGRCPVAKRLIKNVLTVLVMYQVICLS